MAKDKKNSTGGASASSGRNKSASETPPKTNIRSQYVDQDARDISMELFGRELTTQELSQLVGAQSDSDLIVRDEGGELEITVKNKFIDSQVRRIGIDEEGKLYIYNDEFFAADNAPKGFGTRVFTDQVNGARAFGVKYIKVFAAGAKGSSMNGYYTWPRLGYDGKLDGYDFDRIPSNIPMAKNSIQELYRTQAGRDYWRENGMSLELKFDLNPNSISSRVLNAYNEERAKRESKG